LLFSQGFFIVDSYKCSWQKLESSSCVDRLIFWLQLSRLSWLRMTCSGAKQKHFLQREKTSSDKVNFSNKRKLHAFRKQGMQLRKNNNNSMFEGMKNDWKKRWKILKLFSFVCFKKWISFAVLPLRLVNLYHRILWQLKKSKWRYLLFG